MSGIFTINLLLLVCFGSQAVRGEEACLVSDLRAMAIRLRELNTKTQDSISSLKAEIADLKTEKIESQNSIATLTQEIENLKMKNMNQTDQNVKVAFIARKPNNTDPPSGHQFVFTIEELDTNNAYDTANGTFTTPVHGIYLFSVQMCIRDISMIYYTVQSSSHTLTAAIHSGGYYGIDYYGIDCSSATTVAELEANVEVWVESRSTVEGYSEIYLDDQAWNMFSGILIRKLN